MHYLYVKYHYFVAAVTEEINVQTQKYKNDVEKMGSNLQGMLLEMPELAARKATIDIHMEACILFV